MVISFLVIAFNEERNIVACLESIRHLDGLPTSFEIVVVNDGSQDATAARVRNYAKAIGEIKLIEFPSNRGRGAARSAGIDVARGQLVATIDGDIILPSDWLIQCKKALKDYDAVSATPIPDGDAAYVYQLLHLRPKMTVSSTTITGSNGLYKREIFSKITFDPRLREGEDTDFNYKLVAAGYKLKRLSNVTVLHNEKKSFPDTMAWLYQYGYGATRHLKRFRKLRLPDFVFFGFVAAAAAAVASSIVLSNVAVLSLILLYIFLAALLHLRSKFAFQWARMGQYAYAWLLNTILMTCYMFGRVIGAIRWNSLG